jgi:hypothetical protein
MLAKKSNRYCKCELNRLIEMRVILIVSLHKKLKTTPEKCNIWNELRPKFCRSAGYRQIVVQGML